MDRDQVLFRLFGKYCPEGTILFTEGAPGEELFVVQSGAVRVSGAAAPGPGAVLGPGGVLGEEAFFARALRGARAEIVEDSRLLQVSDRNLDAFVRHGPEAALELLGRLLELEGDARAESAAWALAHAMRQAGPALAEAGETSLTPGILAESAGIAAKDARRLLEELERRGVAAASGGIFRFPDRAALERAAAELLAGWGA